MNTPDPETRAEDRLSEDTPEAASAGDNKSPEVADRPREIGGRGGLDPTRYGDWEKAGRCIDF
ncbi:MAG TPA: DUF1674 domain-containing protein [Woeseiaceae bacterium]|jgi:hypothetical protein|nr:DUF1674 domain-containing protein [Woeseiaceae bacterium]